MNSEYPRAFGVAMSNAQYAKIKLDAVLSHSTCPQTLRLAAEIRELMVGIIDAAPANNRRAA